MSTPDLKTITRSLQSAFIKFDHVTNAHRVLAELVAADFRQSEPDLVCIVGETGTGKTWLVKHFADEHPRIETETATRVTVLLVSIPPKCTIKALAQLLLRTLGSPLWNTGNETQLTVQLETLLARCEVKLIILNEANHLVDRGRERTHYLLGDWIKLTSERTGVPVALVGIPRLETLLRVNEQLADRVRQVIEIEPFGVDERCKNKMVVALRSFDQLLEGIDRIPLTDPENARRFALATAGRLRRIRRILVEAVRLASKKSKPQIDLGVLAQVFRTHIYEHAPDKRNPFVPAKFDGVPLTNPGEPYEPRRLSKEEFDA